MVVQGQLISWFWLETLLLLPDDFGMSFFAFIQVFSIISFLLLNIFGNESTPYVPKRSRPPKSAWIKSFIDKMLDGPLSGLWSQLIPTGADSRRNTRFLPYGYILQPMRKKLDHHMLRQPNSILILKHIWLMM